MNPDLLTAEKKLVCVAEQIDLIHSGKQKFFGCPYCGHRTAQGETFCCDLLMSAVKALLDAELMARNLEICERIGGRVN